MQREGLLSKITIWYHSWYWHSYSYLTLLIHTLLCTFCFTDGVRKVPRKWRCMKRCLLCCLFSYFVCFCLGCKVCHCTSYRWVKLPLLKLVFPNVSTLFCLYSKTFFSVNKCIKKNQGHWYLLYRFTSAYSDIFSQWKKFEFQTNMNKYNKHLAANSRNTYWKTELEKA